MSERKSTAQNEPSALTPWGRTAVGLLLMAVGVIPIVGMYAVVAGRHVPGDFMQFIGVIIQCLGWAAVLVFGTGLGLAAVAPITGIVWRTRVLSKRQVIGSVVIGITLSYFGFLLIYCGGVVYALHQIGRHGLN